jgi:hypothetical protein
MLKVVNFYLFGSLSRYSSIAFLCIIISCSPFEKKHSMKSTEMQLTSDGQGHTLHNTQVFSPDDKWIVYDSRNKDSEIGSTETINMVNVETKEIKQLYQTESPTPYGPGVGAATFSPTQDKIIFIHGVRNISKEKPYSLTRRTGVSISIQDPLQPHFMDARDILPPFTPGALRGGTHAHSWSGDGRWISFTYNDYIIEQLSTTDSSIHDLRTIGVMVPRKVWVEGDSTNENNSGDMFSIIVAEVVESPIWGSDEIDKAFDEGWIGKNGYKRADGTWQEKAIAFQGNTRNQDGQSITEVFVLDLPSDLTIARPNKPLEGTINTRPNVPADVIQRRITYSENGISEPRHWLRTTSDGSLIAYLAKDDSGYIQIYAVSPQGGGIPTQLTNHTFSVQGPFNFSPDGKYITYPADNDIFVTNMLSKKSYRLTNLKSSNSEPVGAPVWSNKGDKIAYNRYVKSGDNNFLQIFLLGFKLLSSEEKDNIRD